MKTLLMTFALMLFFSHSYAGDKLNDVIAACGEFDMKTNPASGDKFLIECVENQIKDISFLDENELAARGAVSGAKQSKSQSICTSIKKIDGQISDLESEIALTKSATGMSRVQVLRSGFEQKFELDS